MMSQLEERQKEMLGMLKYLVKIDSETYDKTGVDTVGTYLAKLYEAIDFHVSTYPNEDVGDFYTIRHKDARDPKIIVAAHLDTVFPNGTAKKRPFTIKGGRAYGPGVIDMKASHVLLYYTIKQLITDGHQAYKNIEIVLNSDEEIGSKLSKSFIEKQCEGKQFGLVLEPARANGAIVSARRGTGRYTIDVYGKAAHAGIDPENGRSAIEELSHKVIALHQLTNPEANVHVNVGLIKGGTSTNAVADHASCEVDVRISKKEQAVEMEEAIRKIVDNHVVEGVSATLTGEIRRLPMVFTEETANLVNLIQSTATE